MIFGFGRAPDDGLSSLSTNENEEGSGFSEVDANGFEWGPVLVRQYNVLPEDRRILSIKSKNFPSQDLEIYISKSGKSVRVFKDGIELR